jgi:alanine dehydrogenase
VDEWEQASHNGDIGRAVDGGSIARDDVTELGDILLGNAPGRESGDEITVFDSTGLAVQDLAVAALVYERADELGLDVPTIDL